MTQHPASAEVLALLHGDLSADRAARVVTHLQSCGACAAAARSHPAVVRSAAGLTGLLRDAGHPDVDSTLTGYVDATLPPEEREAVELHLAGCARCREDVADLRTVAATMNRTSRQVWPWIAAAAAVLCLAILGAATFARRGVTPTPVAVNPAPTATASVTAPRPAPPVAARSATYARSEWTAAVQAALQSGAVAMPAALADLQLPSDELRGPGDEREARLEPAAEILDETRPHFRWPAAEEATYVVSVFAGNELAAESGVLSTNRWRPEQPLARGRRYHWQVEVRRGEERTILPAPPAPPAFFRILGRDAREELRSARQLHGDDPLLLGILYARHGLRDAAVQELTKVQSPEGQRLRRSIAEWPVP
ncbi:MAG TPA: zf-HC2 domain-containing protein [Thermoanaerobaculia bacterium]|nr:zf-HC2 domain-containing protein [Thermoanaerobaculia bacterium]